MIARMTVQVLSVLATAAACWAFPRWGTDRLLPALDRSGRGVINYRGRTITYGLGVVWLLWAGGALLAGALAGGVYELIRVATAEGDPLKWLFSDGFWPQRAGTMISLVLAAFGFGLVDDLFGDRSVRGFRGHLGELFRGRLTTGALKVLGIGAASAFAAASITMASMASRTELRTGGWQGALSWWGTFVLATLVIALSANLVNLMDLRPGRALKVYALIATVGAAGIQATWSRQAFAPSREYLGAMLSAPWIEWAGSTAGLLLLVLGPVLAVWRHDLGERGMLGDAGANAAGALGGYLLASSLPFWGLAVAAAFLLALNLAPERVSYTEVIESSSLLRYLDRLGRLRDSGELSDGGAAPPDAEADERDTGTGKDGAN